MNGHSLHKHHGSNIPHFPIIAIGASAGGLEAASRLLRQLPAKSGMAFILVQHLDPTHASMLVELLGEHSAIAVVQATDAMPVAPDHLYVIPPGRYLSVRSGALHLTPAPAQQGARLSFDLLLKSLALDRGPYAAALILSGTGSDGSAALPEFKELGGFIIAQDPDEAEYDGMPRSAILTGLVDAVLPLDRMPEALAQYGKRIAKLPDPVGAMYPDTPSTGLSKIIAFLQQKTPHDFRLYKPGTLERRIADLENELEATQVELQSAIASREAAAEEHRAINEIVLSVNEELTLLNAQLQETLERQRTTSDDLQNVLYSTNVATLFLDRDLNIRFFTPATRAIFNVIPGDIGRPLSDLHSHAQDEELLVDARTVLACKDTIEREISARDEAWFQRRISPYLAHDGSVEGVVITFVDITERKQTNAALEVARQQADLANAAKSRFLAAASHDLRQPLQSLTLLQALLAQIVEGEKAKELVSRFDQTLGAMSGMLNALLDINQIEAGVITAKPVPFPILDLLDRLRDEFAYLAQAKNLSLHILPSSAIVESDPHLLEQMIRNLLANAVKYTKQGKILVGCRRHGDTVRIQVCDSGIGIAEDQLHAIFDEFHQVGNPARARSLGLGLGLSIVQRLGALLGHEVQVQSTLGMGSVFSVDIKRSSLSAQPTSATTAAESIPKAAAVKGCEIVVIEDDPDVLDLLAQLLHAKGHIVRTASDGDAAIQLISSGAIRPDIILADYNLPHGMNGLQLLAKLRHMFHHRLPGIILTGDISTKALAAIAMQDCVQLSKPVQPDALAEAIVRLLPAGIAARGRTKTMASDDAAPTTFVVDDDPDVRASICAVLEADGHNVEDFDSAEAFLESYRPGREGCMLLDANLPGMSGIELLHQLREQQDCLPVIIITGSGEIGEAVRAMKEGACDFIEKPVGRVQLLASVSRALEQSHDNNENSEAQQAASRRIKTLTKRQHQIMDLVLAGHPSKNIAADLGLSQRTVENHRASIMRKMGAKSLPELARLALAVPSAPA